MSLNDDLMQDPAYLAFHAAHAGASGHFVLRRYPAFSPNCTLCARLVSTGERRCEAFARIPDAVWLGDTSHRAPLPGDGGKTFLPLAP
jgi:hypothetical protein